jgi:hypothetical protein
MKPKCRANIAPRGLSRLARMARSTPLALALALAALSAFVLAACGGESDANLLPGTTADQIESNLDEVKRLVAEDDCIGAEDAVAEVTAEVEELDGVAPRLKTALQEGTAKLSEVVGRCEEEEATEETEPALEAEVEPEEDEDEEKPKKEKPDKKGEEAEETGGEAPKTEEAHELPPQSNGKGEEKGGGPAVEPELEEAEPTGGVGPAVEGE